MHLKVVRTTFTDRSTIGELHVDQVFECFTLEDMVRPVKIPGMTAIPEGVYVLTVTFSSRFQRLLPEVTNVPDFTGVRLHPGNTAADTEGCLLVGKTKGDDFIGDSRLAFNKLFPRIQEAAQREKIFIEVTSSAPATRGAGFPSPPPALAPLREPLPPARLDLVRPSSTMKKALRRPKPSARPATAKTVAGRERSVAAKSPAATTKKRRATARAKRTRTT